MKQDVYSISGLLKAKDCGVCHAACCVKASNTNEFITAIRFFNLEDLHMLKGKKPFRELSNELQNSIFKQYLLLMNSIFKNNIFAKDIIYEFYTNLVPQTNEMIDFFMNIFENTDENTLLNDGRRNLILYMVTNQMEFMKEFIKRLTASESKIQLTSFFGLVNPDSIEVLVRVGIPLNKKLYFKRLCILSRIFSKTFKKEVAKISNLIAKFIKAYENQANKIIDDKVKYDCHAEICQLAVEITKHCISETQLTNHFTVALFSQFEKRLLEEYLMYSRELNLETTKKFFQACIDKQEWRINKKNK